MVALLLDQGCVDFEYARNAQGPRDCRCRLGEQGEAFIDPIGAVGDHPASEFGCGLGHPAFAIGGPLQFVFAFPLADGDTGDLHIGQVGGHVLADAGAVEAHPGAQGPPGPDDLLHMHRRAFGAENGDPGIRADISDGGHGCAPQRSRASATRSASRVACLAVS